MSSPSITSKLDRFSNPQENFKEHYNCHSFPQANPKNYDFEGISDMVWRKNRFIETEYEINQNHKIESLNLSIDQDFMSEHTDVLINAVNDYTYQAQRCLKIKLQVERAKDSESGKFFDDFDAVDFICQNGLLSSKQKSKFKQEIKYNKGLYNFHNVVASSMPSLFKDELSLISIVFFNYCQNINPVLVDDQKDLEQIVQKCLDQIVGELFHQHRISKIFFRNKEKIVSQFINLIEKWFLTFLLVKFQFFTNKFYFKKKRIESESHKDRMQKAFIPLNRNTYHDFQQEQSDRGKRSKLRF